MRKASPFKLVSEWVGGFVARAEGSTELVWMLPNGTVMGTSPLDVGASAAEVVAALKRAIQAPQSGRREPPTRLRVASAEFAALLRRALPPALDVLCAPTPELDALAASSSPSEPVGWHVALPPSHVAAFFAASAAMFRAEPWHAIPSETCVLRVDVPALKLEGATLSVVGAFGHTTGFLLFADEAAFDAFVAAAEASPHRASSAAVPSHYALTFDRERELGAVRTAEIVSAGWDVAAENAYPNAQIVTAALATRAPDARELALLEAICLGLARLVREEPQLPHAWKPGRALVRGYAVNTSAGEVRVEFRAPYHASVALGSQAAGPSEEPTIAAALAARGKADGFDMTTLEGRQAWMAKERPKLEVSAPSKNKDLYKKATDTARREKAKAQRRGRKKKR